MLKLFKAQLRKGRLGLFVVVIFIILAVFLMTMGITLLAKSKHFYRDKIAELNSAEAVIYNTYSDKHSLGLQEKFLSEMAKLDYVKDIEAKEAASFEKDFSLTLENGNKFTFSVFLNIDSPTQFPVKVTHSTKQDGIPIYMSTWAEIKDKHKLGEKIIIEIGGVKHDAYIAGFFEHLLYLYNKVAYFTDTESYNMLMAESKKISNTVSLNYEFKFTDYNFDNRNKFAMDFDKVMRIVQTEYLIDNKIPPSEFLMSTNGYSTIENAVQSTEPYILLMSLLLIVFAVIIAVVALLILRYLIKTGIEDDVKAIGINKAIGFTSRELRLSYLLLYGLLLFVGCIIGITVALCMAPVFGQIITILANLYMSVQPNFWAALIALGVTISICLLSVYTATKRLDKVTPLHAIRGNVDIKKLKKNAMPLEHSKLEINAALGVKSIVNNKSQSVMIFVIVLVMSFLCAFASVCYNNMNLNKSAMLNLAGRELFDVGLHIDMTENDVKAKELCDNILDSDLVDDYVCMLFSGDLVVLNDEIACEIGVVEDYSKMRTNTVYEGRFPEGDFEVSIPGVLAKELEAKIGSILRVEANHEIKTVKIVGLTQSLYTNNMINISLPLYKQLFPMIPIDMFHDFQRSIYLKDSATIDEFMTHANNIIAASGMTAEVYNNRKGVESSVFDMVTPASTILLAIVLSITAIVVGVVIFMIIRIKLIREKRNIAINKALGFTSLGITHQIGLSILFVTLPGVVVGTFGGGALSPIIIGLLGKYIGLMKLTFVANYWLLAVICATLVGATYLIASLTALSTRAITPRTLVGK